MRTTTSAARPSRSLASIFEDAITVLRQDLSEYGYIGLCGAATAAVLATVLRYIDNPVSLALIAPVIVLLALGTLATCAAALERTQDGLQPDSGRSFTEAMARAPWLIVRALPPIVVLGAGIYAASAYGDDIGTYATLGLVAVLAMSGIYLLLPIPMYVAAMFSRDTMPAEGAARATAIMQGSRSFVVIALLIALAPAEIAAVLGVLARFGTMTTFLFALTAVFSMPIVASMMSLIHAEVAPWIGATPAPRRQANTAPMSTNPASVAARLDRHMR